MRRLKVLGHPVHPALTDFPLGLLPAALAFDLVGRCFAPSAWVAGYWCTVAGVVLSAPTALSGLLDLAAIPREQEKAADLAIWHLCAALTGVGCFVATWVLRPSTSIPAPDRQALLLLLEAGGALFLLLAGWLGGHLVFHHAVGVDR